MSSLLFESLVENKLKLVNEECHRLLLNKQTHVDVPQLPARDTAIQDRAQLPRRKGLNTATGQAHLLHDLANIELQAMELGVRTLHEFPNEHHLFREELVSVVIDEARHLQMCMTGIEKLGFKWGDWPVHSNLWTATTPQDSLLDRILIVHCYLEGSGLDSSELILNKLSGVTDTHARDIVKIISHEEIRHVQFGLNWYKTFCSEARLDCHADFSSRLQKLNHQIPTRTTYISEKARAAAGFDLEMIEILKKFAPRTNFN
jgi:uncharacterized ferritin-like protein (DUF455 family)